MFCQIDVIYASLRLWGGGVHLFKNSTEDSQMDKRKDRFVGGA